MLNPRKTMPKPARAGRRVRYTKADGTEVVYEYRAHEPKAEPPPKGDTVDDLIATYEQDPESDNLSANTQRNDTRAFGHLSRGLGNCLITDVTLIDLKRIRNGVYAKHGPGSARMFAQCTMKLFNYALENSLIAATPAIKLGKGIKLKELQPWTQEDIDLAEAHLSEHLRWFVVVGKNLGARISDLIKIRESHYDGNSIAVRQKKTGEWVRIPLAPDFKAELDAMLAERKAARGKVVSIGRAGSARRDDYILVDEERKPWSTIARLELRLRRALLKIEGFPTKVTKKGNIIPDRTPHGLRYYICAVLASLGCDPYEIMAISGHQSLAMVQKYTKMYQREIAGQRAVARLAAYRAGLKAI